MRQSIFNIATLLLLGAFVGCVPDKVWVADTDTTRIGEVDSLVLKSAGPQLIADPSNFLDLQPLLYKRNKEGKMEMLSPDYANKAKISITDERGNEVGLRYVPQTGESGVRRFQAKVVDGNGKALVSNTVEVEMIPPYTPPSLKEIPFIIHLVQSQEEVQKAGLEFGAEKFMKHMRKLNDLLAGRLERSAVGTDSRIQFVPAKTTPSGLSLKEEGIDRLIVSDNIELTADKILELLKSESQIVWDTTRYFNIYMLSSITAKQRKIHDQYLALEKNPEFAGHGIVYVAQDLDRKETGFGWFDYQVDELVTYVGRYLGLLYTTEADDKCEDTVNYTWEDKWFQGNMGEYKETQDHFFLSRNLMDDRKGMHTHITPDQARRMHDYLETKPYLGMWKNR